MNQQITFRPLDQALYQRLLHCGADPLMARLYASRSVHSENELKDDLSQLLPYHNLKNIDAMAARLAQALQNKERIVIVADYDADGATACALGLLALGSMGAVIDFAVPNRFENGYGLTPEVVNLVLPQQPDIILTVDNGIASFAGIEYAQSLGIEVLVTDHHLPAQTLPECLIVNPNQPDCPFPSKNLAGVGVIFYVLMALRAQLRDLNYFSDQLPEPNLAQWLDLVALGTVADVVNLDHNNRVLVSQGLKRIRQNKMSVGMSALFSVSKRPYQKAAPFDMGFALGPRLNAAGRLDDMSIGIRCLISQDSHEAMQLAQELDNLNQERRAIEQSMHKEALTILSESFSPDQFSLVAYQPDWHQGVVGIVASRLKEQYYRPTIVFAPADNNQLRGSGRSITGFHLRDALDWVAKQHPDLLIKFGGHAMAAGVTIDATRLEDFKNAFEQATQTLLLPENLSKSYLTDGSLNANEINLENAQKISHQVWGQGFGLPTFVDQFSVLWQRCVGKNHKKIGLNKAGTTVEAMLFNFTDDLPNEITAVYRLVANEWNNQTELQLYIDFWQPAN
ncbi:single-stranded-DNA-specific exonuclease RecJ [Neisseria sp. Ec49-e6-T10]|uniref:single-stranded-DNA-specific exonuclease RecJ n=1 Tax=Neisseria sp. Ec49-e6-T10 TaxID=3140744 RepID=UPI003EBB2099